MKLSVIIVNYNVKYFVEQCLYSVRNAVRRMDEVYGTGSCEVFVVDNNSVDGSVELIAERFPEVHLIANTDNPGFSKANNQAIRISEGEYVLLLNPDTVVEEDTFTKTVRFMDEHPEAGGLGVYMVDGKGNFLPESKRGLPTPEVAFYKIFGLSALFKSSRRFGKYHLTFLSRDEIHDVDVLSGAFMLMRKKTLDEVGLLDEDFFMYGEDIDLSYRIQKGGYRNYYFPDTRIIHYKGESTKKGSANYVFVFYNAMIIFARKHFAGQGAGLYIRIIQLAIYLRATLALVRRAAKKALLPLLDFSILYACMWGIKSYWEVNHKYVEGGRYPEIFAFVYIPAYILLWQAGGLIAGMYKARSRVQDVLRGVFTGTVIILLIYALLPEHMRFSRGIILAGSVLALASFALVRYAMGRLTKGRTGFAPDDKKRSIIVANLEENVRIRQLLHQTRHQSEIIGTVSAGERFQADIGSLEQLPEIVRIFRVNEIIFSGKELSAEQIILHMSVLSAPDMEFKTAPPESMYIIGSNSVNTQGELYMVDMQSIAKPENRRKKRSFDMLFSLAAFLCSPLLLLAGNAPGGLFANIAACLSGKRTWVGYVPGQGVEKLPALAPSVLHPLSRGGTAGLDARTLHNCNLLYAKNYSLQEDIRIIIRNIRKLGSR